MCYLDQMPDGCFCRVPGAGYVASVSVGRRGKSGTGDSKTQVGLFINFSAFCVTVGVSFLL